MKSGGRSDGGKPPAGRGKSRKGGQGAPPAGGAGNAGVKKRTKAAKPSGRSKFPPFPLFAAWICAVSLLAAIIYFSGTTRGPAGPAPAAPPTAEGKLATATRPEPHDRKEHPGRTQLPPGPTIPPKPVFSSRDLPPDTGASPEVLALNRPAPAVKTPPPPPHAPVNAQVAIVIDDFGPDLKVAERFISLPFPVTLSILPHQPHGAEIAQLAHSQGREVILHLPMEPQGYPKTDPGRGAILLSMNDEAIRSAITGDLATSPHFRGVNNHMGSRFTENAAAMKTVIDELNRRGLFFLDSWTSSKSKAWSTAREMKVPTLKRDIFLDHNRSPEAIRSQVSRLIRTARAEGSGLAIGHPYEATLKALREASGQFEKNGIQVVPASTLTRKNPGNM